MDRLTKYLDNRTKICIAVCEHECVEGHTVCHKCKPFVDVLVKLASYEDREGQVEYGKWISCSERLPDDGDERFYMCTVENHEEDPPMFCQYEEEYGFGFWHDIYNGETLGFVDSEFKTTEELGYEKVIAWQPLPEPYKESRR